MNEVSVKHATSKKLALSVITLASLMVLFQLGIANMAVIFIGTATLTTVLLRPHFGLIFSGAIAFLTESVVVLFSGLIGAKISFPYEQTVGWALTLGALAIVIASLKAPQNQSNLDMHWGIAQWSAFVGPLFFVGTFFASKILPTGNRYAWVMNNDAVNNILMVRDLVNDGGIIVGEGGNPVPFTTAILSLFLAGPSVDYSGHGNLHHDVVGMELFWLFAAVLLGLASGLVAAELLRRNGASLRWTVFGAILVSFSTNMWMILGYPIQYGFLNSALGLALLVIAVLVFQFHREYPAIALGALIVAGILIVATWTPTVLFLAPFIIYILVAHRRKLIVGKIAVLATWITPLLLFIIFIAVVTVPSFVRTSSLLSSPGGIEHLPLILLWLVPALLITLSLVVYGFREILFWIYAAVGLTQLIAVGGLLFLNRQLENPWTYYPYKMLWFGSAFIALIAIPLAVISISRIQIRFVRITFTLVVAGTALLSLNNSTPKPSTFSLRDTSSIFFAPQGSYFNDEIARQMFSNDEEGLVVYWVSQRGDQASALNFWNISNWANSLKPNVFDIRYMAYYLPPKDPSLLCELSELANTSLIVVSEIPDLDQQVHSLCPDASMTFRKS